MATLPGAPATIHTSWASPCGEALTSRGASQVCPPSRLRLNQMSAPEPSARDSDHATYRLPALSVARAGKWLLTGPGTCATRLEVHVRPPSTDLATMMRAGVLNSGTSVFVGSSRPVRNMGYTM